MKRKYNIPFIVGALILILGTLPLVYQYGVKQGTYLEETSNFLIPTDLEERATLCLEEDRANCESGLAVGLECQYSVIRYCSFLARAIMEDERLYLATPYPYTEADFDVVPDIIIQHFRYPDTGYKITIESHNKAQPLITDIQSRSLFRIDGSSNSDRIGSIYQAKSTVSRLSMEIYDKIGEEK